MSMSPETDAVFDVVQYEPVDLGNISSCIPQEQFLQFCKFVVFKTDAIKLGLLCFFLGVGFWMLMVELEKRWKKK